MRVAGETAFADVSCVALHFELEVVDSCVNTLANDYDAHRLPWRCRIEDVRECASQQ